MLPGSLQSYDVARVELFGSCLPDKKSTERAKSYNFSYVVPGAHGRTKYIRQFFF